jgi:hypothetical protein
MKGTFRFYKDSNQEWYIDLPDWAGSKAQLEMVEGADEMLDIVSGNTKECFLKISDEPFEGAEILVLELARTTDQGGGGDYILQHYEAQTINHHMWLCDVTKYVFNGLPPVIYFKKK